MGAWGPSVSGLGCGTRQSLPRVWRRRFDLEARLKESGEEYLFVESMPPHRVRAGETLSYEIRARSRAGGVRFTLESGPRGMSVSRKGVLTWRVPDDAAGRQVAVIVSVRDASGREVLHSFRLDVRQDAGGTQPPSG